MSDDVRHMDVTHDDNNTQSSIVIVCEEDGHTWADFFKVKLTGKDYSINTWIQLFSDCDSNSLSETSKIQVILISPSFLDSPEYLEKIDTFNADTSVLILLGVDESEVSQVYENDSVDVLSKFPYHVIEESNANETAALVKIIQCYEYDFEIYECVPMGKPVMVNKLLDVFPSDGITGGSDVFLLLERTADNTVNIVIDKPSRKTIPTQHTNTAVYQVTIPEETTGHVTFRVESQNHVLGHHEAQVKSKLEQLRYLLLDTADPMTIMCQCFGIPPTAAGLDKKLAEQAKNNWSTHTMPILMQMFELHDHTDETSSSETWPTVLHFAAEYNLELFCTELLKYPGMVNAATVSNVNEQYPCEIAQEKGFTSLSKQLYSIVEKHGRYSDSIDTPPPCPGPHYVNTPSSKDDSYIRMDNLDISVGSHLHHSVSDPSYRATDVQLDESDDEYDVPPARSIIQARLQQRASHDNKGWSERAEPLSEVIPKPATKHGGSEFIKHHLSDLADYRHLPPPPELDKGVSRPPAPKPRSCSLGTDQSMAQLKLFQQQSGVCDAVFEQVLPPLREHKKKSRFSKFFNKFRKSHNESDVASRAEHNKHSSKQLFQNLSKSVHAGRKYSETLELERDSGSYSDEEDNAGLNYKSKEVGKSNSSHKTALMRKKSMRIVRALEDKMDNAPNLPSRTYRT